MSEVIEEETRGEQNGSENGTVEKAIQLDGLSDFSKLIEVIRSKFVAEKLFSCLTTNEQKIGFCLEIPEVLLGFRRFTQNCCPKGNSSEHLKSEEKAKTFRLEGNKCFKNKKYEDALQFYSRALLVAPFPSEDTNGNELSLAFANRSATLFQLNQFADCLLDVQYAILFGYPKDQIHTLELRRALCLKGLGQLDEARISLQATLDMIEKEADVCYEAEVNGNSSTHPISSSPPLKNGDENYRSSVKSTFDCFTGKPSEREEGKMRQDYLVPVTRVNPKISSACDSIKLCSNPEKGCHLKATKAIPRDEVLMVETAYASTLNPQLYESYCHFCCQELSRKLFPCHKCSSVSYCSKKCSEDAWDTYHKYECDHMELLLSTGVLRLSLRILLTAGLEKVLEVERETKSQNMEKMKRGSDYRSLYHLTDHAKDLSYLISSRQTLAGAFMLFILCERMQLMSLDDPSCIKIGAVLLKHIHQISVNSIVMFYQPIVPGPDNIYGIDVKNQVIGTAIYPTISLLNHSCIANTEAFFRGSTLYLKTKRPVAPGEEITYSYGPVFKKIPRTERQETLQNQYYFRCTCIACNDDVIPDFDQMSPNVYCPVLTESFFCKCRGPLVINGSTEGGKCLRCGEVTEDVQELLERLETAKKMMNVGKALIQFGRGQEAEKQYLKALSILTKICWPENRYLVAINTELLYCNIFMENFEEAKKFCEESNRIKKITFGLESNEYWHGVLQLLNLKWTQQKKFDQSMRGSGTNRTNSMNKRLVQKLVQESNETLKKVKENVKKFETKGSLLILDSSLVSCLKELVELEKHLKSNKSR